MLLQITSIETIIITLVYYYLASDAVTEHYIVFRGTVYPRTSYGLPNNNNSLIKIVIQLF